MAIINLSSNFNKIGNGYVSQISVGQWSNFQPIYKYSYESYDYILNQSIISTDGFNINFDISLTNSPLVEVGYKLSNFKITYDNENNYDSIDYFIYGGELTFFSVAEYKNLISEFKIDWSWLLTGADEIYGSDDNDVIKSGLGDDVVYGYEGNDVIYGEIGIDLLDGGLGNDEIRGGAGNDDIDGGTGNDLLYGDSGNDSIDAGQGNDIIFGGSGTDIIIGGEGNDTIEGGSSNDNISGNAGDDLIDGGSAHDYIVCGHGDDVAYGGSGNDIVSGESGDDKLYGDLGSDEIIGGDGDDILEGGEGNDKLQGGVGDDQIFGGSGNDLLWGDEGYNYLDGGSGIDLYGFRSWLFYWEAIEDGEDNLVSVIDLRNSYATINYLAPVESLDSQDSIVLNYEALQTNDILINIESIYDTYGDDIIFGDDENNIIFISNGVNTVDAGGGDDEIIIESSGLNNKLSGGGGADAISFAAGFPTQNILLNLNDTEYFDGNNNYAKSSIVIDGVASHISDIEVFKIGNFNISTFSKMVINDSQFTNQKFIINEIHSIEWVPEGENGYSDNDEISFENTQEGVIVDALNNSAQAPGVSSSIKFYGISDITGSSHVDRISGDNFNNKINGGAGDDILNGRGGNDTLDYSSLIYTLDINLQLNSAITALPNFNEVDIVYNFENVIGGFNKDSIYGNKLSNNLYGNAGNDKIFGLNGNDNIFGGIGSDVIDGGIGDDFISGGNGNYIDKINGGQGVDTVSFEELINSESLGVKLDLTKISSAVSSKGYSIASGWGGSTLIMNTENLIGSLYNDDLTGDSSSNSIKGNSGNDILCGGLGSDALYGGDDNNKDVFLYKNILDSQQNQLRDKIYQFIPNIDKLDLKFIDANTKTSGDQEFKFAGSKATPNSLWFASKEVDGITSTKDIVIYADVDGNTTVDFEIGLVGVTSITAADFVL